MVLRSFNGPTRAAALFGLLTIAGCSRSEVGNPTLDAGKQLNIYGDGGAPPEEEGEGEGQGEQTPAEPGTPMTPVVTPPVTPVLPTNEPPIGPPPPVMMPVMTTTAPPTAPPAVCPEFAECDGAPLSTPICLAQLAYMCVEYPDTGCVDIIVLDDAAGCAVTTFEQSCVDQSDDDGDGFTDCADADCLDADECAGEICDNGADDDGDGVADCADPECQGPQCMEQCDDGRDNDADGFADCSDPDCAGLCEMCVTDMDLGKGLGPVAAGSTVGAGDDYESDCQVPGGSPDLGFSWRAPSDGCFEVNTFGSSFDTVLELYSACPALNSLVCVDDSGDDTQSQIRFQAQQDQSLNIVLGGFDEDSAGDFRLSINECVEDCIDFDDNDLDGALDCDDSDCAEHPACIEEICDNGVDDDGDELLDCADPECDLADGCEEDCTDGVDNDGDGAVDCADSACDTDEICAQCQRADVVLGEQLGTFTGSTEGATSRFTSECGAFATSGDVIYGWTAPEDGTYTADTFGSDYDTVLHVRGGCPEREELQCNDDVIDLQSQVEFEAQQGEEYLIVVDGYDNYNTGDYILHIEAVFETCGNGLDDDQDGDTDCADSECEDADSCVPEVCDNELDDDGDGDIDCADSSCVGDDHCREDCSDEVDNDLDGDVDCEDSDCDVLCAICPEVDVDLNSAVGSGLSSGTTLGTGADVGASCAAGAGSEDIVYQWLAPDTECYSIDTLGSGFDTALHVHADCPEFAELACNDDSAGSTQSRIDLQATGGITYLIVVDGFGDASAGAFQLNINPCP